MEVADVYQVDFNRTHALRVSVSSMMHPADLAECGRGLSSEKRKVVSRDDKSQIHGKRYSDALPLSLP